MFNSQMPKLDFLKDILTDDEYELARGIVATRGKNKACLRASKPKVERIDLGVDPTDPHGFYHLWHIENGETAYIWRMVAFYTSPKSQHHCMPIMADFDLNGHTNDARMALAKRLDKIVDKIVNQIPKEQWYGVGRWGRAFGYV